MLNNGFTSEAEQQKKPKGGLKRELRHLQDELDAFGKLYGSKQERYDEIIKLLKE
jgi:hypothetical protein